MDSVTQNMAISQANSGATAQIVLIIINNPNAAESS
jgi:hypothetical protein